MSVIWYLDTHVHYHRRFGWRRFLTAAFENLDRWIALDGPDGECAGCLCFVDVSDGEGPGDLRALVQSGDDTVLPEGCSLRATDEVTACRIERPHGPPLVLVEGRQLATREGLEVLALSCARPLRDGEEFERTIDAAQDVAALTVIPWGFGKWWGARGKKVDQALRSDRERPLYVGDNGNRLEAGSPASRLGGGAGPVLAGSDPLPLDHHYDRALSYGSRIEGSLDLDRPGTSLRDHVAGLRETPPTFGRRAGAVRFVTDQLRMQWQVRRRRSAIPRNEARP